MTNTILNQHDEDMCWSLYCASAANPLSDTGSFEEFLKKFKTSTTKDNRQYGEGVDNGQMEKQLNKADEMLKGFAPPIKGEE